MASIRRLTTSAGAARYEIRWRPAPGQAERSRRFASLETARAFKAQTEAAQTRGVVYNPTGGRVTFRRYAEQWLEGRPLAETTRDNYAETLERHVYPTFAGTPIGKLTADEIRRWHRPLRERIPSTASRAYRIMHAVLATAVDDELIPRNPCRIKGASSDPRNERTFVPAEVVLALADIADRRIRAMILVAGFGGLRYGSFGVCASGTTTGSRRPSPCARPSTSEAGARHPRPSRASGRWCSPVSCSTPSTSI